MKKQKEYRISSKGLVTLIALIVLLEGTIGGSIAWLVDDTDPVISIFTIGDVTLMEAPAVLQHSMPEEPKLIPGNSYSKEMFVGVQPDSEDCYVFVKFEEVNNPAIYLNYTTTLTTENGWTQGSGEDVDGIPVDVWYRIVRTEDEARSWYLLVDNKVSVRENIVQGTAGADEVSMPAAGSEPQLKYTVYAVQLANLTVADAWSAVNSSETGITQE